MKKWNLGTEIIKGAFWNNILDGSIKNGPPVHEGKRRNIVQRLVSLKLHCPGTLLHKSVFPSFKIVGTAATTGNCSQGRLEKRIHFLSW